MDWAALKREAAPDISPQAARQGLHPAWLLERYGYPVERAEDGRLASRCPFHEDTNPSMDVYAWDDHFRLGCFPCGWNGDVIDFVQKHDKLSYPAALTRIAGLIPQAEAPDVVERKLADPETIAAAVQAAQDGFSQLEFNRLIESKRWPVWRPTAVAKAFGLGHFGQDLVIPHWDYDLYPTGYKVRTPDGGKSARPGSRFDALYGHWTTSGRDLILCEGEPDTWTAWSHFSEWYDVMGLPTGSGSQFRGLNRKYHRVILAFDGDNAGRVAADRWHTALSKEVQTVNRMVFPEGYDLSRFIFEEGAESIPKLVQ